MTKNKLQFPSFGNVGNSYKPKIKQKTETCTFSLQLNPVIDGFDASKNMIEKIRIVSLKSTHFWCKIVVNEEKKIHLSVYEMPLRNILLFLMNFRRMQVFTVLIVWSTVTISVKVFKFNFLSLLSRMVFFMVFIMLGRKLKV